MWNPLNFTGCLHPFMSSKVLAYFCIFLQYIFPIMSNMYQTKHGPWVGKNWKIHVKHITELPSINELMFQKQPYMLHGAGIYKTGPPFHHWISQYSITQLVLVWEHVFFHTEPRDLSFLGSRWWPINVWRCDPTSWARDPGTSGKHDKARHSSGGGVWCG